MASADSALYRKFTKVLAWTPVRLGLNSNPWFYDLELDFGLVHAGQIHLQDLVGQMPSISAFGEPMASLSFPEATGIFGDDRFDFWSRLPAGFAVDDA